MTKENRERSQIIKIRKEKESIRTNLADIYFKKIMRGYYKQLYAIKLNKLDEMDKFLEKHKLHKTDLKNR